MAGRLEDVGEREPHCLREGELKFVIDEPCLICSSAFCMDPPRVGQAVTSSLKVRIGSAADSSRHDSAVCHMLLAFSSGKKQVHNIDRN